ncbi:hypothetical protein RHGRI_020837 [Rhododendron griersonianum]|uniref:Uncharacterized protein n=1 Tax=Rhododendron griersonianum TaxID=479676 RepID=A0AAV6JHU6_9ERIC|nr:hypothetical protein RHGRI_020837 [Rhododendron griersonianum]
MLEIVGHLEDELNNSEDPFILDVVTAKLQNIQQSWREAEKQTPPSTTVFGEFSPNSTKNSSPSRKLQQVFEQALIREAEERSSHLQVKAAQFDSQQKQVQNSGPNPKILYNARGNPYEEGDPNMAAYSTKEELSVSEDQLLVILGGVESSNQDEGELKQHIKSITSLGKDQFEPDYSLAPEPPDQLGSGSKEVADLVSKGSTGFNEYLSKSAKKRLKKQAKEESMEGIKSRPHAKNN